MADPFDRLSRISALKPAASAVTPRRAAGASGAHLLKLVGADCRQTPLGSHLGARQYVRSARPPAPDPETLRLIAPGAPASAADTSRWLFLDTETTGLAGGTGTYAFLVGVAWWEDDGLVVEQLFMRDHSEEPSLLRELASLLAQRPVLVTFNGKSFDWPLLETRYRMTRSTTVPRPHAHLDLLHPARQIWKLSLKSVALSEIERHVLGLQRQADIPSATIPGIYFDFLRGGSPEPLARVFDHNRMDLLGLAELSGRLLRMLADPEAGSLGGGERFGISRILHRRGRADSAGRGYRMALESGLICAARDTALRELALLARRERDFEAASGYWEKLLGATSEGIRAYEQLAIYYEHHAHEPGKALQLARQGMAAAREAHLARRLSPAAYRRWHASFIHRVNRLLRKCPPGESGGQGGACEG